MVFFSLSLSSKWGCHGPWSHCSGLFFPITGWPLAVVAVIREKLSAQCSSGWVMVLPLSRYSAAAENSASRIKSTGSTQSDSVASVRSQTHMIKKKKLLITPEEMQVLWKNALNGTFHLTTCFVHRLLFLLSGVKWRASKTQTKTGNHINIFVCLCALCVWVCLCVTI